MSIGSYIFICGFILIFAFNIWVDVSNKNLTVGSFFYAALMGVSPFVWIFVPLVFIGLAFKKIGSIKLSRSIDAH
jgi:hypothetical protein